MTQEPTDQDLQDAAADATAIDELEALRAEIDQLKAQSLLERADLENQRKRLGRELEMARKFANERLLGDLLPVLDSLEAGLANAPADDPLRAGLELTQRQLLRVAETNGLVTVAPGAGDAFNPEHHQAMSMIDAVEELRRRRAADTWCQVRCDPMSSRPRRAYMSMRTGPMRPWPAS